MGTVGEPFPLDVKIKDGAEECAKQFPQGSVTEEFYLKLAEMAKGWIKDAILEDEEMLED